MSANRKTVSPRAILLSVTVLILWANAGQSEELSVAEGAKLYNDHCARCHNPKPAEHYTSAEWSVIMPHMREKAHLTGTETRAVERFIASTLTADVEQERVSDSPGTVSRSDGKSLFDQFGCAGCHKVSGAGGEMGPDLDKTFLEKGGEFMTDKILNPALGNPSSTMPRFPLSRSEASAIVDYIGENTD
jgi:mono/diheme cytochrome c family protein